MKRSALGLALAIGVATPAVANAEDQVLVRLEPVEKKRSLKERVQDTVNDWSGDIGFHVGRLSLDTLQLGFDVREKRAKIGFGSAETDSMFGFRFESDVEFGGGQARVDAKVSFAVLGEKYELELPTVDVDSSSVNGQRAFEIRLPFLRGQF